MRLGSVRVRTTLAATAVVGVALIVSAVAMVRSMERSLTTNVRTLADDRADVIASTLERGGTPDLEGGQADDEFVQILDAGGIVVAASRNVLGRAPIPEGDAVPAALPAAPGVDFLVLSSEAATPEGGRTVVVGRSLDDVREATDAASRLLLVGVPLLIVVVGGVTWWLAGRALRPVERMRAEVEAISAGDLGRRIDEPGTGDEIARLAATLNEMLSRLESARLRERRFTSDAAHELRSPLAAIRQHAEIAIAHPDRTRAGDLGDVVLAEALRLQRLAEDLLVLARLDEAAPAATEAVDLDDLVLDEAARLREASACRVDTSGVGAGRVTGWRSGLAGVVRNLADNAARHARDAVSFGLMDDGREVVLTVDDDGPGIAPADRERAFERFVRLDEARVRDQGGSGLGLAIVRDVTIALGGTVAIQSSPLGGARLRLSWPSETPEDAASPAASSGTPNGLGRS
jgi:signal transduction histidine kinase